MEIYDGASIRQLKNALNEYGLVPNKRLGQNFLCDKNIADKIAGLVADPDTTILEIGPGAGALTARLAQRARRVVAVEIDSGLYRLLSDKLPHFGNIDIIHADALKFDFGTLKNEKCAVVANLPYYITTAILERLLFELKTAHQMILMMQKEVAQRLCAVPGTKQYGSLTVAVSYHADVEKIINVPPECFFPQPEVDSAVVRLTRRIHSAKPISEEWMFRVSRALFSMRRKTILNNIVAMGIDKAKAAKALADCKIDPNARGETLTVQQFAELSDRLLAIK